MATRATMEPGVHLFIGMRCIGKTRTIAHLLREANPLTAYIISLCEYTIGFYRRNFPKYDVSDNMNLLEHIPDNSVVILDDFDYSERRWYYNKYIAPLFTSAKRRGICFYLTMPYAVGIPPSICRRIDSVRIYRDSYTSNLHRLYELYAHRLFYAFEEFCELMNTAFNDTDTWRTISYIHILLNSETYTVFRKTIQN